MDTATHRPCEHAVRVLAAVREPAQPTAFERVRMAHRQRGRRAFDLTPNDDAGQDVLRVA